MATKRRRQRAQRQPEAPPAELAPIVSLPAKPRGRRGRYSETQIGDALTAFLEAGGDLEDAARLSGMPQRDLSAIASSRNFQTVLDTYRRRMTEQILEDSVARARQHQLRLYALRIRLFNDIQAQVARPTNSVAELTRALMDVMRMERTIAGDDKAPPPPPASWLGFVRERIEIGEAAAAEDDGEREESNEP